MKTAVFIILFLALSFPAKADHRLWQQMVTDAVMDPIEREIYKQDPSLVNNPTTQEALKELRQRIWEKASYDRIPQRFEDEDQEGAAMTIILDDQIKANLKSAQKQYKILKKERSQMSSNSIKSDQPPYRGFVDPEEEKTAKLDAEISETAESILVLEAQYKLWTKYFSFDLADVTEPKFLVEHEGKVRIKGFFLGIFGEAIGSILTSVRTFSLRTGRMKVHAQKQLVSRCTLLLKP